MFPTLSLFVWVQSFMSLEFDSRRRVSSVSREKCKYYLYLQRGLVTEVYMGFFQVRIDHHLVDLIALHIQSYVLHQKKLSNRKFIASVTMFIVSEARAEAWLPKKKILILHVGCEVVWCIMINRYCSSRLK